MASYAHLKRAGSNMVCLCPFHSEKTPSCTVFVARQTFYCFGCGAGGDVISLVRRAEGLEYVEALKFLADRAGMKIDLDEGPGDGFDRKRFYDMNRTAAGYFHNILVNAPEGEPGRKYCEKRGLSGGTITHFGLGYAPDSFDGLVHYLKNSDYTEDEIVAGFLASRSKKNGKVYDNFRKRVMFPIIDVSGNVIAFGGRIIDDSDDRKYLNSSDTPVFKKRKNLYALNFARHNCSDNMILCEGYMDVIALHAAGFENAVATLGTAITQEQARLMAKYTKKVTVCYDNDAAGINATDKAIALIAETGTETAVLHVKDAKDPDEYIKKFGRDAFSGLLGAAKTKFRFKLDSILKKHDINDADGKSKALAEICGMIADVYSASERDIYMSAVAKELDVSYEAIKSDVSRLIARRLREKHREEGTEALRAVSGFGDRINPEYSSDVKASSTEEHILAMLLLLDANRTYLYKHPDLLTADDFITPFARKVFSCIVKAGTEFYESSIGDELSVDEMSRLEKIKQKRVNLSDNGEDELVRYARLLRDEKRKKELFSGSTDVNDMASFFAGLKSRSDKR